MTSPTPGTLLIAEPPMADPHFKRAVILLCEHSLDGSFGLVLNRPAPYRLTEVADVQLPMEVPVGNGGPVQPETLHFLHPYGDRIEGSLPIADGVWWGGNLPSLLENLSDWTIDPAMIRFFLGYSGWGPGQLDEEVDDGGWILLGATDSLVFAHSDDQLWRDILRELGGEYALLSTFPDDPRLN
ncbi:MAG: YqgE/AlgH family protein [Rubricoccaceae bacterium]|nr:YqgE/AlgH family protein [Rubricoccaceae bacterium]